ncbi:MAG: 3-phosphoshikimate 1-carboxyvinyltransferase, partial [Actinomycetota bacterium]|nr:3-phosphoshikimate 1-carboxyvinyltransferase [Actinomycetota bacterium]
MSPILALPSPMPTERPWAAPVAGTAGVRGTVTVPGSKSLTNRALVLAALADQPSVIRGGLVARDTRLMAAGLQSLGADVAIDGTTVAVSPRRLSGGVDIDCGLAGTVMRFLPPVAALARGDVAFDGDPRARQRPLAPLLDALGQLGVRIEGTGLPLVVRGAGAVPGREATIDSSASSQFISGLLLAAARFDNGLDLRHRGAALPSLPHIRMTIDLLAARGVTVRADTEDPTACRWQVAPGPIAGGEVTIEPDLSNAGPFLAAAMVTGGRVSIP